MNSDTLNKEIDYTHIVENDVCSKNYNYKNHRIDDNICVKSKCNNKAYCNDGRYVYYCELHLRCGNVVTKSKPACNGCKECYRDKDIKDGIYF